MASCSTCGTALAPLAKFCGSCGNRVLPANSARPARFAPSSSPPEPPADPFAQTVFGGDAAQPPPVRSSAPPRPNPGTVPIAYLPGAGVLVHWADGRRYPATVVQTVGAHVLVTFRTGQQQWVDIRYVSSGRG